MIAFLLYCAFFGLYIGVLAAKEREETIKGLAFLNPIFILVSDVVVLSLREQTVRIRVNEAQPFIYSTIF